MSPNSAHQIGENWHLRKMSPQKFSLPGRAIRFMIQNNTSPIVYEKLTQCCKHFYTQNPIIVVEDMQFFHDFFTITTNRAEKSFRISYVPRLLCKLWITDDATVYSSTAMEMLRDKVFQINKLIFSHPTRGGGPQFVLEQFSNLQIIQSIKTVYFQEYVPEYADGSAVPVEKLFELFPNLQDFRLWVFFKYLICVQVVHFSVMSEMDHHFTSETAKKIVSCPSFKNLKKFFLSVTSESFDFQLFVAAMKVSEIIF